MQLQGHSGPVYACAAASRGQHLASAGREGSILIWDLTLGDVVHTLNGHRPAAVNACAWNPSGTELASGGDDMWLRIWDPVRGSLVSGTHRKDLGTVQSVAYHASQPILATAHSGLAAFRHGASSCDAIQGLGVVVLWCTRTRFVLSAVKARTGRPVCMAFHPSRDVLFVDEATEAGGQTSSTVYQATLRVGPAVPGIATAVQAVIEGHTPIANTEPGRGSFATTERTLRLQSLAFSPNGTRCCIVGDRTLSVVASSSLDRVVAVLRGHEGPIFSCAWSRDGRRAASGGHDKLVMVWDMETMTLLHRLIGHAWTVFAVTFATQDVYGSSLIASAGG